ncbi:MAG TPA: transporter [Thermoanaerobaculia bacterium]|nr:transporter [Thermoanaerobaculia bacterium]
MNRRSTTRRVLPVLAALLVTCQAARSAQAQQLILKGEYGLMAGTQAPPGLYAGLLGGISWADELRGPNGNKVPSGDASFNQYYFGPLVSWVSNIKILGGNYGAVLAVPFANVTTDFPRLDVSNSTSFGLSQLWIVPVNIGWHFSQADVMFQYAFYPPTGRYTPGASNNTGLGMWCNEVSVLSTVFFDEKKNFHASASLFYDINSKKQGTDWTTGNPITLMYGVGANYGSGQLFKGWAGVAGYAQWQVTETHGADVPGFIAANKTQIYALGPEFTTLQGALTIRYFWQFGGKFSTQGRGLYVQFAVPI